MYHIFIISLVEDVPRREHVLRVVKKLQEKNVQCTIVDAYYWKSHNVLKMLEDKGIQRGGSLSLSQIACFLSHHHVWTLMTCPETKYIVIEDDIDISDDFDLDDIDKAVNSLDSPYDALILYKHPEQEHNQDPISPYFSKFYYTWGTNAYLFTCKFAQKLLEIKYLDLPVDELLLSKYYNVDNTYVMIKQYFINHGFTGGYKIHGSYLFKSNIWG